MQYLLISLIRERNIEKKEQQEEGKTARERKRQDAVFLNLTYQRKEEKENRRKKGIDMLQLSLIYLTKERETE